MSRETVDRACELLGVGDLVRGRSDRECWEMWGRYVGHHGSLIALRIHLATVLPQLPIDKLLTHREQREMWNTLVEWGKRFA